MWSDRGPVDEYVYSQREKEMKTYTILLLRPDYIADEFGKDTYLTHVRAESVETAEVAAQVEAYTGDCEGCTEDELAENFEDYAILLVIEGQHLDIKSS